MARVYADVNQNMPRAYWDYDSVNISEPRLVHPSAPMLTTPVVWLSRAASCWLQLLLTSRLGRLGSPG